MIWDFKGKSVKEIAEEMPFVLAEIMTNKPLKDLSNEDMLSVQTFLNKIGKSVFNNMAYKGKRIKFDKNDNIFTPILRLNRDENMLNMSRGLGTYLFDIFNNGNMTKQDLVSNGSKTELEELMKLKSNAYVSDEQIKVFGSSYVKILTTFYPDFTQFQNRKLGFNIDKYKEFAENHFKGPLTAVRGWKHSVVKNIESLKNPIDRRIEGEKYLGVKKDQHPCYETNVGKFYYTTAKDETSEKVVFVPKETPDKRIGIAFDNYNFGMSSNNGEFDGFIIDTFKGNEKVPFSLKKEELIKSGFRPSRAGFDVKERNIVEIAQMIGEAVLNDRGNKVIGGSQSIEFIGNKYRGGLMSLNKVGEHDR